jgi:hypothetical protein
VQFSQKVLVDMFRLIEFVWKDVPPEMETFNRYLAKVTQVLECKSCRIILKPSLKNGKAGIDPKTSPTFKCTMCGSVELQTSA